MQPTIKYSIHCMDVIQIGDLSATNFTIGSSGRLILRLVIIVYNFREDIACWAMINKVRENCLSQHKDHAALELSVPYKQLK